ncbi:MAG TPA: FAD-dependent oxidoreductase [Candidatus Sumerlaeota bacterium]|nr:FAD-dependent oxidoreductase [Candidatus Sumerlaeota bacterium]HOR27774.1 FAD-dependent oxidoreductase [Candidatus Sumerlaeota bacterium]
MATRKADAIIIGSGQAGVPLALKWDRTGKKVILFEKGALGGSCVNYGCTPSKAFLAAAHRAQSVRSARELGVYADVRVEFAEVMKRVRDVRAEWNEGVGRNFKNSGIELIEGVARFAGERRVEAQTAAGTETAEAPLIVIDTGSAPRIPAIPGLEGTPFLTNMNFFDLREQPRCLIVLGGGYVGLELGQGMSRLGSEVHILERGDCLLHKEDARVSECFVHAFENEGIKVHLEVEVSEVQYDGAAFHLKLVGGTRLEGDALLVAVGRRPNSAALQCARSGIELTDEGFIQVDERLRTTCKGVFAAGEVAGQPPFTHAAWEDHLRILDTLEGGKRTRADRALGYCTFTEPQMGRAGLSMKQAQAAGYRARCVGKPIREIARAAEWCHHEGFFEMVIDEESDRILGATLVGHEAGELVHLFLGLIECKATWRVLADMVAIHPTYGEGLRSMARQLAD